MSAGNSESNRMYCHNRSIRRCESNTSKSRPLHKNYLPSPIGRAIQQAAIRNNMSFKFKIKTL